jgi:hypothetical protein
MILMICQDHGRSIARPCNYVYDELKRAGGTRIDDPGQSESSLFSIVASHRNTIRRTRRTFIPLGG